MRGVKRKRSPVHRKQGTRLQRVECPSCGYLARITRYWLEIGAPSCPCGSEMREAQNSIQQQSEMASAALASSERDYWSGLREAILAEGGMRPEPGRFLWLPRSLVRLQGSPIDELPLRLESYGYHFENADALVEECRRAWGEVAA